jgi:parallel beta-helix repeat protein
VSPESNPDYSSTTRHVHDGDSIQSAIEDANIGGVIIVHKGTYNENVYVHKALTIQAASGEDRPVINGGSKEAFSITADGAVVEGFEARSAGFRVVVVMLANKVTISNNVVTGGGGTGIVLSRVRECDVIGNEIYDFDDTGIDMEKSNGNTIKGNKVSGCSAGISVSGTNQIIENEFSNSKHDSIMIEGAFGCLIKGNKLIDSGGAGILLESGASYNQICGNDIRRSLDCGISLCQRSSHNLVRENQVAGSGTYDLYWDESGTGNLWEDNSYETSYPDSLTS